ncbi:MAG TPA: hypothetical protein VH089_04380 [Streptosporangiaceae bacterium]|jgi:hypothetical protein|nr:hypothetical protein [Streptosporangiaceae bacterium]
MRKPTRLAAGVVAAAAVAAGAVQALPAGASTAAPNGTRVTAVLDGTRVTASPDGTRVTVPMTITGFNAAVAKAHGYVIRTDAQGRQYSVKAGAPNVVSPDNTVYGNCGSSYLYEYAIGLDQVEIETGFNVNTPAVAYWWEYSMRDGGGTSSHTRAGGLAARSSWGDNERWGALTRGPASAWVDSGSDAILVNGDVCTSGGPSDSTTIY